MPLLLIITTVFFNGECCKNDCSGWKTDSVKCLRENAKIDAAFMDYNKNLHVFQVE